MKTKIITAMGISALALSFGQSSVSAQEKGTVTASSLNIRSGPGLENSVKGYLYKGDTVVILEKSNGWLKIQLSNKTTGWVSEKYIEIGNDNINTKYVKVKCSSRLNVRSGPATSYQIKTRVENGTVHKLLEKSNGWYKIQLSNGITGWVSSSYVQETNDSTKPDDSNIIETEVNANGKTTANLNVRSGPGTNYSVKTVLKNGEVVTIKKSYNSWYEIKTSSNITGWVSSQYINITHESPNSGTNNDNTSSDNSTDESRYDKLINFAMTQIGKPYVWGGNGPNSFDCSGFTRYVYLNAMGISLPRVSYDQAKAGTAVDINNLKKGDLLYFATVTPGRTSHVGIYIGDNQFIHASGTQTKPDKVKISSLSEYYGNVLLGARRF